MTLPIPRPGRRRRQPDPDTGGLMAPQGESLHIGVNKVDPAHYNGWEGTLRACEFDAEDMRALAVGKGFTASILLTPGGDR